MQSFYETAFPAHTLAMSEVQDAVERALEEDPAMRAEMGDAARQRARAAAAKELGNDAFKARDFDEAVTQYSAAIEADNTDATFYSNRRDALIRFSLKWWLIRLVCS
jgi:hypothetical protein